MLLRSAAWLLVAGALAACARGASDGEADSDGSTTGGDDTGTTTGPSYADSGPPAQVGDDTDSAAPAGDSGNGEGSVAPTSCTTVADCNSLTSATAVSGVACADGGVCAITCSGENYDVNGVATDGCEVPDICPSSQSVQKCPVDDHSTSTPTSVGTFDCTDGDSGQNITGLIPSDARVHSPQPDGFDPVTGSAPDYFTIVGSGGLTCQDDANLTLQMNAPTAQQACYELHLLTDKNGGQSCTTGLAGNCSITNSSGSYSDGSTLTVWVTKIATCTAAGFPDDAAYTITGHL